MNWDEISEPGPSSSTCNENLSPIVTNDHWGEIGELYISESFVPDVSSEIQKSMNEHCLDEYKDEEDNFQVEEIRLPSMDPLMLYSIQLHKYMNDMTEMIRVAELAKEMNVIAPEDAKPPFPEMPELPFQQKDNTWNSLTSQKPKTSIKTELEIPELSEAIVKKILSKCVATMFSHIGFETSHQSVLDVLVDVLETFFQKICARLIEALEEENTLQTSGFPDAIDRVLTEIGSGGIAGLHDYYKHRIVKYINVLRKRCKDLDVHYARLLLPKRESPDMEFGKLFKVKVEEEEVAENENPELHFTIDGEVCSTLEPGYQLLNSLEAEANLQSLTENEEDSSPGVVSIPTEPDICNLSPFTKRKKHQK